MVIEYSSPNTNKPLHLGHIRNNLLGYSFQGYAVQPGNKVIRTNIVNDRGYTYLQVDGCMADVRQRPDAGGSPGNKG
ncbi:MAG: arginine--tRNA ligase [Marinilabiliales bacterium]|nr:arginine--tRNA ligase [Marinilabiliales bacterium]